MIKKQVFLLSVISGILLSLPWVFPQLGWAMFVAFVPLLFAGRCLRNSAQANDGSFFISAFIAFLVWNVGSTWWIAYVSFAGMLLISGLNALLMASVWWGGNLVRRHLGSLSGYFALLVFWIAFEFLQHNWTLLWPWMSLGNGFANSVKMIQWYEYTGVLGGSFWIILTNILIFLAIGALLEKSYRKAAKLAIFVLILIGFPVVLSVYLYSGTEGKGPVVQVAVLQPNVDPYTEKFDRLTELDQLRKLDSLAASVVAATTDLIVAPETALPPLWEDSLMIPGGLNRLFPETFGRQPRARILSGALTNRKFRTDEPLSETARLSNDGRFSYDCFNSALILDQTNGLQIGHKRILVNGVERMPFQKYLSFPGKFMLSLGGTSGSLASAPDVTVFRMKNDVRIGSVICFESAFGNHSAALANQGANLLVVITNDGWWKASAGNRQHFSYSRLRAIETRRSVARSANTGISGFINSRGDVLKASEPDTCEALSAPLCLNGKITFYVRYGDFIGRISLLLSGLIFVYLLVKKRIERGGVVGIPFAKKTP